MRHRSRGLQRVVAPVLAGILLAPWLCAAPADAGSGPPPVADFFRNADMADEKLSPSGKYLGILGHDASGVRVPLVHGEKLRAAIATPRADVEWIVYTEEGHGWFKEEHRTDFWTRVENFLDKYLKAAPSGPEQSAAR